MTSTDCYIVVEGVIGVGKTTLARLLQPALAAELVLEEVEENPFLSGFYTDRTAYAFQTETFFLLGRLRQHQRSIASARGPLVSDYLFAKNALFARLTLGADERELFEQLYSLASDRLRRPDLVIYLQASVDTLMERIAQRDRPFERQMQRDYIAALHDSYERFMAAYHEAPLLTIETDQLNVVADPAALAEVLGQVRGALAGYVQPALL